MRLFLDMGSLAKLLKMEMWLKECRGIGAAMMPEEDEDENSLDRHFVQSHRNTRT